MDSQNRGFSDTERSMDQYSGTLAALNSHSHKQNDPDSGNARFGLEKPWLSRHAKVDGPVQSLRAAEEVLEPPLPGDMIIL